MGGSLVHIKQNINLSWDGKALGNNLGDNFAMVGDREGRLEFIANQFGSLQHIRQNPDLSWGSISTIAERIEGNPAMALNRERLLEVTIRSNNGMFLNIRQNPDLIWNQVFLYPRIIMFGENSIALNREGLLESFFSGDIY